MRQEPLEHLGASSVVFLILTLRLFQYDIFSSGEKQTLYFHPLEVSALSDIHLIFFF